MPPEPKRRLTVLNNAETEESVHRRPWQWVGFGALTIFTTWIPLAALAGALASRFAARALTVSTEPSADVPTGASTDTHAVALAGLGTAVVATYVVALALGAVLGGLLVGRWGTPGVGVREAALAGLGASVVAAGATAAAYGPTWGVGLVAVVAVPMAALGGRLGVRARRP